MTSPLAAVFVGSDTLLMQCLATWQERGHRVAAVVTDADKVRRFCVEQGWRHLDAGSDWVGALAGEAIDHLFAITWLRLLPAAALALPKRGAINFHDGPLPRYAGLNATCWAILHGENEHGITWHEMEVGADKGAILLQRRFAIGPDDTAFTLNARCFQAGLQSFGELADQLAAGTVQRREQDKAQRTWFGKTARPEALAVLDFTQPAAVVARTVRAFDHAGYRNPLAIAKVRATGGVFVPGGVEVVAGSGQAPATVVEVGPDFVVIACGDGDVRLLHPRCLRGSPLGGQALAALGVRPGTVLPRLDATERAALTG
ncbi:MAG: formyltransferase family protein, partial [Planctomycetota bacterium]